MDLLLLHKGNVTRSCQSINWIARLPVKCPAYLSFLNSITSILVVSLEVVLMDLSPIAAAPAV